VRRRPVGAREKGRAVTDRVRYRTVIADNARWDAFEFRAGDIVISTAPKSGTTWMQMLCALLVFQDPELDRPLTEISPWIDMQTNDLMAVLDALAAQRHRRFVKTHTPFDGLPVDDRVAYVFVGRDPRDVCFSMNHHVENIDFDAVLRAREAAVGLDDLAELLPHAASMEHPDDPRHVFRQWVDDPTPIGHTTSSLLSTLHHADTFWRARERANVVLVHYSDLQADLVGEMRRLADALGIEVADDGLVALASAARFDAMKSRAEQLAPDVNNAIWRDTTSFFHRGESGSWRALLDDDDLRHYEERVASLVAPDLAAWIHTGFRAIG
jgi:hypothetical protein